MTQAGLSIAAATAGSYGAYRIGQGYKGGYIGYGLHKALHFMNGGLAAALIDREDPMQSFMLAGASAAGAEMGMEWLFPDVAGPVSVSDSPVKLWDARESSSVLEQRQYYAHQMMRALSVIGAATVGGNPFTADTAADTAIRNNFFADYARPEFDEEGNLTGFSDDHSEYLEYGRIIDDWLPSREEAVSRLSKVAALLGTEIGMRDQVFVSPAEMLAVRQASLSFGEDYSYRKTMTVLNTRLPKYQFIRGFQYGLASGGIPDEFRDVAVLRSAASRKDTGFYGVLDFVLPGDVGDSLWWMPPAAVMKGVQYTGKLKSLGRGLRSPYQIVRDPTTGKRVVKGFQMHHIVSDKNPITRQHDLLRLAGFNLQDPANKILLPTRRGAFQTGTVRSIHQGRHLDIVSERLATKMQRVVDEGQALGYSQREYREKLLRILEKERAQLKDGSRILNKHHQPWAKED